jgi:phosphatidate cytidylyltransferase
LKELITRSVSGLIYIGLMIGAITIHPLLFVAVFALILILGMIEFYRLTPDPTIKPWKVPGILTGLALFLIVFLIADARIDHRWLVLAIPALLIILSQPLFVTSGNPTLSAAFTLLGLLYVVVPITLLTQLMYHPYTEGFDYQVVLLILTTLWINDTGAYLTGLLFGRHKVFSRISPKKSWEGIAGGLILSALGVWILQPLFPDIPALHCWILLPVIVFSGTIGDFTESAWKRSAGVKDSGKIMPGHGGILDRFDSIIFAAPAVYVTIQLLNLA